MLRADLVAGRYAARRVIGGGQGSVVLEVHDQRADEVLAMKTVGPDCEDPEVVARLRREAYVMAAVRHRNVCTVFDMGEHRDGRPFFVLERMRGGTLRSALDRDLFAAPIVATDIVLELCTALHALHALGIVHRDVRSENVFLSNESTGARVKLFDFARCGPVEDCDDIPFEPRLDVFAAGLVLFEALTGSVQGIDALGWTIPPALENVLRTVLAEDPANGYPDVSSFAADLVEARQELDVEPASQRSDTIQDIVRSIG
jgi:eukaryotic-like serine/threonine-protein kinase